MKKGEKKEGIQKIKFQNVIQNTDIFTFHGEIKGKKKEKIEQNTTIKMPEEKKIENEKGDSFKKIAEQGNINNKK